MMSYSLSFNCSRDIGECWGEEYRDRIVSDLTFILWSWGDFAEVDSVRDLGGRDGIEVRFDSRVPLSQEEVILQLSGYGYDDIRDIEMKGEPSE